MPGKRCQEKQCKECGKTFGEKWDERPLKINKNGKFIWVCGYCWYHNDYRWRDTDRRTRANRRTGNLDPNSAQAKGDRAEKLTCILFAVENLNEKLDCYNFSIDHSNHYILGIIQTRSKFYDSKNRAWTTGGLDRDCHKDFDNMIFYCISQDGKLIERIYIFPKWEILGRQTISIYKNPSKGGWYEQYRITDEEMIKKANEIWKKIINGDI